MKTAVVTGASSGIGLSTAKMLYDRGYRVYNLSRSDAGQEFCTVKTDVTDEENIRTSLEYIISEEGRIDLLVCCAGMGVSGAVEFISTDDMKRQFDVNLYGTINTVKNVIPYMREKRQGRIICVSSVAGVYAIPFQAYYSASKAAINSFVDAVSNEVKQFNIDICAVMPGDIKTGFTEARKKTAEGNDIYNSVIEKSVSKMEKDEMNGMAPENVASLILKIAEKKRISTRYTVGISYSLLVFLKRILPHKTIIWLIGKLY